MDAQVSDAARRNLLRLAGYQDDRLGPGAEMIRGLKATYLTSARDERFGKLLEKSLLSLAMQTGSGLREEAKGIVVLAETGAGKSRLIRRNIGRHALFHGFMQENADCPALGVRCLQAYTLRVLATEILTTSGYPVRNLKENKAWAEVRDRLQLRGVLLLWIDEVNNLLVSANSAELQRILNSFKAILNHPQWPVILVLSGTPECEPHLRQSSELCRRMRWMTLDPMTPGDFPVLASHVAGLCGKAQLSVADGLLESLMPRLVHAAGVQFGNAIDLVIEAIGETVENGRKEIGQEDFATTYALRTQATAEANPFVALDWARVVPLSAVKGAREDDAGQHLVRAARHSRKRVGLA